MMGLKSLCSWLQFSRAAPIWRVCLCLACLPAAQLNGVPIAARCGEEFLASSRACTGCKRCCIIGWNSVPSTPWLHIQQLIQGLRSEVGSLGTRESHLKPGVKGPLSASWWAPKKDQVSSCRRGRPRSPCRGGTLEKMVSLDCEACALYSCTRPGWARAPSLMLKAPVRPYLTPFHSTPSILTLMTGIDLL